MQRPRIAGSATRLSIEVEVEMKHGKQAIVVEHHTFCKKGMHCVALAELVVDGELVVCLTQHDIIELTADCALVQSDRRFRPLRNIQR